MKNHHSGPTGVEFGARSVIPSGQILLLLADDQLGRLSSKVKVENSAAAKTLGLFLSP